MTTSTKLDARTNEFSDWFSGSKVLDRLGRPKVVFHGTDCDFDQFEVTNDIGFHFGGVEAADARMRLGDVPDGDVYALGANLRPAILQIRNPLRLPDLFCWDADDVLSALADAGFDCSGVESTSEIDREWVRDRLAASGYDGIVYSNITEGGGDSYIVFSNDQIRPWYAAHLPTHTHEFALGS